MPLSLSVSREPIAHRPLASLSRTGLENLFCTWLGASGRRYICSVYPLDAPPPVDWRRALVAAVRHDGAGARILFLFQPGPAAESDNFRWWTRRGTSCGAQEWHVHLLAETAEERAFILRDLSARPALAANPPSAFPPQRHLL